MELMMSAATDCGTVRKENEDFYYYSKKKKLVIVCDGMGGHQSGATASKVAGETVRDVFLYPDLAELMRFSQDFNERLPVIALRLIIGIRLANRRLRLMAESDQHMQGMGTTIAAMAFSEHWACVTHVGDSRIYYLHKKNLKLLTEDHSWINELLQDHDIRAEEVKHFRKKNVLTRALGTHPAVKIDVQWFPITGPGKFLLCSDGLHNVIEPELMLKTLQDDNEGALQKNVEQLVQRAKTTDGSDNITAAVVMIKNAHAHAINGTPKKMTVPEEPEKFLEMEDHFLRTLYAEGMKTKSLHGLFGLSRSRTMTLALAGFAAAGITYGLLSGREPEANNTMEASALPPQTASSPAPASEVAAPSDSATNSKPPNTNEPRASFSSTRKDSLRAATHNEGVARTKNSRPSARLNDENRRRTSAPDHAQTSKPEQESAPPSASSLVPQTGGRIFLPGLHHNRYTGAIIFVDDHPLGTVKGLGEAGFLLKPGTYAIAVKDSTGRILHQKANVNVSRGDVKTLEFKE